ncbi:DUF488 domain-containing protein [Primorskyibacter marinus]|uniref:DUF488 domain-containing protein n=1 Tax=Primorskyibacter marinus TaxID=1977320 RepID=UPI000E30037F|nr:DUF488 family protein [Primorskyibacter marinus]
MTQIWLRRAYDEVGDADGQRILVDRIWPRGVSKEDLQLDDWMKEIAPSDDLRDWFDHDPDKWDGFKKKYAKELDANKEDVDALRKRVDAGRVTLVFGAKDEEHNNAVALKAYLEAD